jgi:hypothetical protein
VTLERFGEFKRFVTVRMAKDIVVEAPVTVVFKRPSLRPAKHIVAIHPF